MRTVALQLAAAKIDSLIASIAAFKEKPPVVTVQGDIERGATLFSSCASCHAANGRGNERLHAPALANRSDWYLVAQLNNYRAGLRGVDANDAYGRPMRVAALSLPSAQAVVDVVAYINTLR
jgi:cytochrome c oxidase subunit 2